jgi:16S rRNA (cytosine1402-N4)-methyltransferase
MSQQVSSLAHTPVLLKETIKALDVQAGGRYIDCTVGGGSHAATILGISSPGGQLLGIDADPEAVKTAQARLETFGKSVLIVNDNFVNLEAICIKHDFMPVHGILFDLGLSSLQLNGGGRGFSFQQDAPLDMRFNPGQRVSAADIVNNSSEAELAYIIRNYGEESCGYRIARRIVRERPLKTTAELARVIEQIIPRKGKIHPATKTFQALRIAVNHELDNLEAALKQAVRLLGFEGRLVVISYHSLEDRIVKRFMQQESRGCICPPGTPSCICKHTPSLKLVSRNVITPSPEEVKQNPRSRSARLRVAERIINQDEWYETADRLCLLGKADARVWKKPSLLKERLKITSVN